MCVSQYGNKNQVQYGIWIAPWGQPEWPDVILKLKV